MKMGRAASICLALLVAGTFAPAQDRGSTQTQIFGVTGRGSSFVFVFDRSLSMQGVPLAAAKRGLIASLGHLQRVHQFQIIFYNEKPRIMPSPQMLFADENGLREAESFINSITAAGGTDHVQALQLAMRLQPDVIFLLTDADEPPISPKQLSEIRKNNTAAINVIQFQAGQGDGKRNFLRQLAEENRGEYKSIDTNSLTPAK